MAYNSVKKSYTDVCLEKILSPEVWEEKILSKAKSPTVFLIFRFARFSGVVPACSKVFPYVVPGRRTSYLYLRACLYEVSQADPLSFYRAGSAHALYPLKNVVVFIMGRQAGTLAEISARATGISASWGSPPPLSYKHRHNNFKRKQGMRLASPVKRKRASLANRAGSRLVIKRASGP